ncbi:flavin reductase family protein [Pseudooceanicola sp.]|uniref:flavin reductase family protein n=1 Tax=Pseudooceanicola sp. TaxID=1914328 RepID=UPI003517C7B5
MTARRVSKKPAPGTAKQIGKAQVPADARSADPIDAAAFKFAMRKVPSPVAVITTVSAGRRYGLTATAICTATADPPTILVSINRAAAACPVIEETGIFAVNFLTEDQSEIARLFTPTKRGADVLQDDARFHRGDWTQAPQGAPVLRGAVCGFDCTLVQIIANGTHNLFLGEVTNATATSESGLLYRDRLFRRLATE